MLSVFFSDNGRPFLRCVNSGGSAQVSYEVGIRNDGFRTADQIEIKRFAQTFLVADTMRGTTNPVQPQPPPRALAPADKLFQIYGLNSDNARPARSDCRDGMISVQLEIVLTYRDEDLNEPRWSAATLKVFPERVDILRQETGRGDSPQ